MTDTLAKTKAIIEEAQKRGEGKEETTKAPVTTIENLDIEALKNEFADQGQGGDAGGKPDGTDGADGADDTAKPKGKTSKKAAAEVEDTLPPRTLAEMKRGKETIERRYASPNAKKSKGKG